ncbi:MAG: hypothetical protein OEV44_03230 [Spirochaetota bacterium]|nr:hypothetical protein [Spirochaetota bacterium]
MNIRQFSGGKEGIPSGACGLLTAVGKFTLENVLNAAKCLQYRGREGSGLTLKGVYPFEADNFFNFHIMYRDPHIIDKLEGVLSGWGLRLREKIPLVQKKWYNKYDLPKMFHYRVTTPDPVEMLYTDLISDPMTYIRKKVTEFNIRFIHDARIFSCGRDTGTFLTAFQMEDTLNIFDIYQYNDIKLSVVQIHMRWPTSKGRGLWWGPQPIALGDLSGTHNGHLSSDKSNAIALEQLGIPLHVGTDSEALFRELYYLVNNKYSLQEMEWIISRKFPQEIELMEDEERERYIELTSNPILNRFKISGPTTAIVLIDDLVIGLTDRDHLRAFTIGYNENVTFLASEERAVVSAAFSLGENIEIFNPDAGKLVAFKITDGVLERLNYEWKKTA